MTTICLVENIHTEVLRQVQRLIVKVKKDTNPKNISEVVRNTEELGASCDIIAPLGSKIKRLTRHEGDIHAIVFRFGKEFINENIPTPAEHAVTEEHRLHDLDLVRLLLIGSASGFSYAYSDQANGNLCDDVMPLAAVQGIKGFSQGSEVGWHTEDAAFNTDIFNCAFDVITMAFYRNDNRDNVYLSHPELRSLDSDTVQVLKQPLFPSLTSLALRGDQNHVEALKSIVYGDDFLRVSFARFDELRRSGLSDQLIQALERLQAELDDKEISIDVEPGDIVFVDNMRTAHRRAPWNRPPKFDGADRWQRRLGFSSQNNFVEISRELKCQDSRVINNQVLKAVLAGKVQT